jgi:hypothetical protein
MAAKIIRKLARKFLAEKVPADVERYVKDIKKKSPDYDDAKVWATAWSIFCKHKDPGSDHCKKKPAQYFPGKNASVNVSEIRRAMQLIIGPGFGSAGMSMKQAASHLVESGLTPELAFLTVQAGANLARKKGHTVLATAGAPLFNDPTENAVALKVLQALRGGGWVPYGDIAPLLKGHRDLWEGLTEQGFVNSKVVNGEHLVTLHPRRPSDWRLLGLRG